MADKKISELTSGSPALSSDAIPISRSGANYRLAVSDVAGWISAGMVERSSSGTLASATVLQLFTTPVTVVADVAGISLNPRYLYVRKRAGTAYTLNGSADLRLNFGASSGTLTCFQVASSGTFDQAAETKAMWYGVSGGVMNVGLGGANAISGLGFRFLVPTANWTVGNCDIDWKLLYYELTE